MSRIQGLLDFVRSPGWWNLSNLTRIADLLVRFATILGALVVANFFGTRASLAVRTGAISFEVDLQQLNDAYDEAGVSVPSYVFRVARRIGDEWTTERYGSTIWTQASAYEPFVPGVALGDKASDYLGGFRAAADQYLIPLATASAPGSDLAGAINAAAFLSGVEAGLSAASLRPSEQWIRAAIQAESGEELSVDELELHIESLRSSLKTRVVVELINTGDVTARNVTVFPPAGFQPSSTGGGIVPAITSGSTAEVQFHSNPGVAQFPDAGAFIVDWQRSGILDMKKISWFVWIVVIVVTLTAVKEIFASGRRLKTRDLEASRFE